MTDLPNELPPNPFDDATPAPPVDVSGTPADFLSSVSPPDQGNQIPAGGPGPDYQTEQDTEDLSHEHLKGTYMHDPRFVDTPQGVGNILTTMTKFGGAVDAAEERRHPGKGDSGGLAWGNGRTYDPKTGMDSNIPVVALPDAFKKVMPYGTQFDLYNPKDPSRRVTVVYGDRGPASYTGVGADAYLPKWADEALNVKSGEQVGMDMTGVIAGTAPQLSQPPQPGTSYDQQVGNAIRERMTSQPQSLMAGDVTADAVNRAMQNSNPTLNKDGSVNYGGGVSIYPETGIIQYETSPGGPIYQKLPNQDKFQRMVPHLPPQPPELVKETREAGKPLFNDDGTPKSGLQLQQQLDEYYTAGQMMTPRARQEVDKLKLARMGRSSVAWRNYENILGNYDAIRTITEKPDNERTGADDIQLMQAMAAIEAPGRSSTGGDFKQWMEARGLAGTTEVQRQRLMPFFHYLTGQATKQDLIQQGRTLPPELIPQLKRVADTAMESRYKVLMQSMTDLGTRVKQLGGDPNTELPELSNPVTGISPWGEGGLKEALQPQTKVVKEVQPGTTRTMTPSDAVTWAKANQNSADQETRDTATKILTSVQNSGQ